MFAKTLESAGPTLPAEAAELEGPWGGGLTDEEGALLSVLRLLNRSAMRQDLVRHSFLDLRRIVGATG